MAYFHGAKAGQKDTSISTPVTAGSGIAFIVGTSPVHMVNGQVNEPIMAMSYGEAVQKLGYSENWENYTLCEVMYSQFVLYEVAPVVFVNVLDPSKHKKAVAETDYPIEDGKVLLPLETLAETVEVTGHSIGEDYELLYDKENLILEVIEDGGITPEITELTIKLSAVDATMVDENDIIGGFDLATNKYQGLELIDKVFPKYGIITDLILAPKWSKKSIVAAVMATKAENINGIFEGKALVDIESGETTHYTDVPAKKKEDNIFQKYQQAYWPMVKLGDRKFHISTQMAGRMANTDRDNGDCPTESPSNKPLKIDGAILEDGTEVLLDLKEANYLNSQGVGTVLNFIGGYVAWGNETACFPADTDVKNYFTNISRMFAWVANSVILTYWSKVDKNMTPRFVDSIVDSINIWLNGLTAEGKLLGGRVEFKAEDNSLVDIMSGKATFHIYLTPPSPAREIHFLLEYDTNYVLAAFAA